MSGTETTQECPFVATPLCGWFFGRRFRDCPQPSSGITPVEGFGGWRVQGLSPVPRRFPSQEGFSVLYWLPLRPDSPRARARLPSEFPFACNLPLFICLLPTYTIGILERLARERHPSFRGGRRRCKVSHKHSGKRTARTNGISGERS